jgi:hypothetical protein
MVQTVYTVPLNGAPQQFTIGLGGVTYTLLLKWNAMQQGWFLDIGDSSNNPIVSGIPLVTGVNLLEQYGYLGFNGSLYVQTASNVDAIPTFTNLGTDSNVFYVTAE